MTRFRKHHETPTGPSDEDPLVRQYRYLLRTAPLDALEAARVRALDAMDAAHRSNLQTTLRATLLIGGHVRPSHTRRLAHWVTSQEHRAPGTLLGALDAATLYDLPGKVLQAEARTCRPVASAARSTAAHGSAAPGRCRTCSR